MLFPALLSALALSGASYAEEQRAGAAPAWVIVRLTADAPIGRDGLPTDGRLLQRASELGIARFERLLPAGAGRRAPEAFARSGLGRTFRAHFSDPARSPDAILTRLAALPGVELAEPDAIATGGGTPNDTYLPYQWGVQNNGLLFSGSTAGADIQAVDAWDIETGDGSVIVAVLDTGVNTAEPDLSGQVWANTGEVAGNSVDDDANGYVDDTAGWDFAYTDASPSDVYGHGTNVSGIAVASGNNSIGYAGMCWDCQLMNVKVLDDANSGYYTWIAAGVIYAVDNDAHVVNMSLGGATDSSTLLAAVQYADAADVTVVVSMMNYGTVTPYYPAAYTEPIAVGATDFDDTRVDAFFWGGGSSYGSHIDVVAPGNYIYGLSTTSGWYYSYWGGTSQATPYVAGLAALLLTLDPTLLPADIRAYIEDSAEDRVGTTTEDTAGWDMYYGYGRINAWQALALLEDDLADADGDGYSVRTGDCDDANARISPGVAEIWYDGIDGDCDEANDYDADADGYDSDGYGGADCDDTDAAVSPAGTDTWYDGVDSDCDGASDYDADGDGFDSGSWGGADCNDVSASVSPAAADAWYDGVDANCDGASDYDADADGFDSDGYGGADCNDVNASISPAAADAWYDGVDANCDGASDYDADGDGFDSDGWGGADCNDASAAISPVAADAWYDGVDADCDGADDYDADADGFDSDGYGGADCNDVNASISPAATDAWYDGVDSDCDGASDYDADADGFDSDGYGGADCNDTNASVSPAAADAWYDGVDSDCDGASDYDSDADGFDSEGFGGADCDDTDAAISPAAADAWYDGLDADCDGASDYDADADGFDSDGYGGADCNDVNASISPAAADAWYDGVDANCD
ncbi:MAG: S8 family serine peptidase, partial [Pseudomonadota bacterium]|nr:S8 family serine peptidase [Pseudomonadota bacterium]